MASPPFAIAETTPQDNDVVLAFPLAERTYRDIVESWLTILSDPTTGKLKSGAFSTPFSVDDVSWTFKSTDGGATALPILTVLRASPSPLAADLGPQFNLDFFSSTGVQRTGFRTEITMDDVTNATEDTTVRLSNIVNGAVTTRVTLTATGTTISGTLVGTNATFSGTVTFG